MFERNDDEFGLGRTQEIENDPVERLMKQPEQTAESAGGSYYSPRSGESGGGYIPPTGGFPDGGSEPPKKKPHKGLKALAMFAGVAFVAYASIQCYQYATENPSIRSFLGRQSSSVSEESDSRPDAQPKSSESSESKDASDTSSSKAEPTSFFEMTARKDAMTVPDIVKKVTPATVGVSSTFILEGRQQMTYDPFSFWGFGGFGQQQTQDQKYTGVGTGIIMRDNKDGSYYIITNAHVIYDSSEYDMGLAREVQVVLNPDYYPNASEKGMDAQIVGYNVAEDIAVLKVKSDDQLRVAEFGDSDDLEVGELVIAIGNPLGFELFGSVTTGIVSALNREVSINDQTMNLIQTDTAINAGNSGGPLINCYGQVIGINSSKISSNYYSNEASVEGLCFAIPMTHAQKVINDLINYGYVTGPQIGITQAEDVDESVAERFGMPVGIYIKGIEKGSAADKAGLRVGDIITAIDDVTVTTTKELSAEKDKHEAGDTVVLTVIRQGQELNIEVTLTLNIPAAGTANNTDDRPRED